MVIYETKGRAREYCEHAVNLYTGCGHGCVYCYAPDILNKDRNTYINAKPRPNILKELERECAILTSSMFFKPFYVLLSFITDPYQPAEVEYKITRRAIEILHSYGFPVMILTKGGKRALRDFDLLTNKDWFGVTLTLLDETMSRKWEPYAALPEERIETLKIAHNKGIKTWVSLEPVLYPDVTLEIIKKTHTFVDEFKVGILNYHEHSKSINWHKFAHDVLKLLVSLNCHYYIKHDLRKFL